MSNQPVEIESFRFDKNRPVEQTLREAIPHVSIARIAKHLPGKAGLIACAQQGSDMVGLVCCEFVPGKLAIIHLAEFGDVPTNTKLFQIIENDLQDADLKLVQFSSSDRQPMVDQAWLIENGYQSIAEIEARVWAVPKSHHQNSCGQLKFELVNLDKPGRLERVYNDSLSGSQDCQSFRDSRSFEEVLHTFVYESDEQINGWFYVQVDEKPIGCLLMALHNSSAEILYFGIIPTERGKGFGQKVLQFAKSWSFAQNASFVLAYVDEKNLPATKLYDCQNFFITEKKTIFAKSISP